MKNLDLATLLEGYGEYQISCYIPFRIDNLSIEENILSIDGVKNISIYNLSEEAEFHFNVVDVVTKDLAFTHSVIENTFKKLIEMNIKQGWCMPDVNFVDYVNPFPTKQEQITTYTILLDGEMHFAYTDVERESSEWREKLGKLTERLHVIKQEYGNRRY